MQKHCERGHTRQALQHFLENFHWCTFKILMGAGVVLALEYRISPIISRDSHSIMSRNPISRFEQYCFAILTSVVSHARL